MADLVRAGNVRRLGLSEAVPPDIDLTPSDLERIEEVAPKGVAAERCHEAGMRTING